MPLDRSQTLAQVFPGDSDMARLMRETDWAATPLGAPEAWPNGLKTPLAMMLTSRFEMWLGWGDGLHFFYNDAYVPTLGIKHPEALGRPVRAVWPEIYADVEPQFRSVMLEGRPTWNKAMLLLLERSGYPEETYHTFSYSPLRDGDDIKGLMCVVTEETERVISERRLETVRRLGECLIGAVTQDAVLQGVCDALADNTEDFPFSLAYVRDPQGGLVGCSATEDGRDLLQRPWPLDAAPGVLRKQALPLAAYPTGTWAVQPTECLIMPIAGAKGELAATLVLGLNPHRRDDEGLLDLATLIADRAAGAFAQARSVEEERRRSDRIWTNARDLMVVVDDKRVFQSVSPAWTRILGHNVEDVIGRRMDDFIVADDKIDTYRTHGDIMHGLQVTGYENRYRTLDGGLRWISWNTAFEDGLIYGYGRDITEERQQAQALKQAEDALRQAQKMEAVGQLTGGLAHDFNNLLSGIAGSFEMISSRLSQGRMRDVERYLSAGQGATRRAAALTHRLLAFSRRQTLSPRPIVVNRLMADLVDMVRRTVGPSIAVETVAAGGLWPALVDSNQLENALLNLCINARDAMPDGGSITIETGNKWLDRRSALEHGMEPGQYVTVCVSDTGVGIDKAIQERVFDPFFTTKPIGEGTGLGLSMVYGFAKQSHGHVRIYSELGQGTMVCIYLPRHFGEEEIEEVHPTTPFPQPSAGETVLVVDDEPTIRMLIVDTLSELGYSCAEAPDGPAGLKILQSSARIDLLITDVGLPGGLNGRQVADAARVLRPDLKVLFITGYAENAVLNHGHIQPGMEVVTKPFAVADLAGRVDRMLRAGA